MGMFDEVGIHCPRCKRTNIIQSKAGKCQLNSFTGVDAPAAIAVDIDGKVIHCEYCGLEYKVQTKCLTVCEGVFMEGEDGNSD